MCTEDYKWHYDYVRLAWDAGFSFDKCKYPNLDKNKICLIDIDRVIKDRDIASIERFLPIVVQYVLENDQAELLDSNFVKMFRISQLSVEYLLFCKKYLDNTVVLLKRELSKVKEENKELKLFTEELEIHISTLTKHNNVTTFKCDKCPKIFSSEEYLNSHKKRRHNSENKTTSSPETDQLQSEIKQLKERLNIAEKLLQEKEEKVESVKLDTNENENKLRVDEVLEKFEKFKDKVENDIKILQIEKNFYEEKYGKLFDVVLESNRKESAESVQGFHNQEQTQEKCATEDVVDKIEMTTQTEKENIPVQELQIETVHDKNMFELKDVEIESGATIDQNIIQKTIEQKIDQFEDQLELKISSGLSNIEKQMQAFWGKLSEIESKQKIKIKHEGDMISYRQEPVRIETAKPMIKPRMKLSKPSKYTNVGEGNAKKLQAEIEKMSIKPVINTVTVEAVPEKKLDRISSILYDSSSSPDSEKKSDSESDSSVAEVVPHKIQEVKPSVFTLGNRSITSLKKVSRNKEATDKLRKELNNVLNDRLQDIGISANWKGIPQKTFEKALEIVRHQGSLLKKSHPNFDSIRKSIEKSLNSNKEIAQKLKNRSNFDSASKQTNVISIKYRKKPKKTEPEPETKPVVTIKNRSLYNTDSDSENLQPPISPVKSPMKVLEVVPSYSAVIKELKQSQNKNLDTDSEVNSIILPKEEVKSVLKNYPSMGSLTKKKVLFDIESDKIEVDQSNDERRNSLSIDSSDVVKVVDDDKKLKKNESSLSDFDLSEL